MNGLGRQELPEAVSHEPSNTRTDSPLSSGRERIPSITACRHGLFRRPLLLAYPAQEGAGARAIGERAQDAQRIVPMNSDSRGKAVEVHTDTLELGEQLLEPPLVSHALSPFATPASRSRDDGAWLTYWCRTVLRDRNRCRIRFGLPGL